MPNDTPTRNLSKRFREHLLAEKLLPHGGGVVVGVSGRRDSVALLHLLHGSARELGLDLVVAHVQHGNTPERAADAAFVRDLAGNLNLPFDLFVDEQPASDEPERTSERARYFERVRSRVQAAAVATGETLDDAAEALLETLVGGGDAAPLSPLGGSSSMQPLLPFTGTECQTFLAERGLPFRQDPDALRLATTRKKLRLLIFPLLRRHVERSTPENLAAAARLLADDEALLEEIARAARSEAGWRKTQGGITLDHRRWAALPPALRRRILADAARTASASLSRSELLDADTRCRLLHPDSSVAVGALNITLARGTLTFVKP